MEQPLLILAVVILLALAFDFINGFHDCANAIATSVSTGVLSPRKAIMMAAGLNFVGAIAVGDAVAKAIGKGIVDPAVATQWLVVAALLGAIIWNLVTWYWGLPSSSSHALIGGIIGAAVAGHGWNSLQWEGIEKIVAALISSPLVGFLAAFMLMVGLLNLVAKQAPQNVSALFRVMQIVSAAFMSFSHGANDAQKAMGIITLALVAAGYQTEFHVPLWVMLLCATAMGLGTSAGGWKIIKTMGSKIVKIQPIHGFAAETAAAVTLVATAKLGLPVSTTHVINGCIMGVGATKRLSAVRWGVAGNIVMAWVFTIPVTALLGAVIYWLMHYFIGF